MMYELECDEFGTWHVYREGESMQRGGDGFESAAQAGEFIGLDYKMRSAPVVDEPEHDSGPNGCAEGCPACTVEEPCDCRQFRNLGRCDHVEEPDDTPSGEQDYSGWCRCSPEADLLTQAVCPKCGLPPFND